MVGWVPSKTFPHPAAVHPPVKSTLGFPSDGAEAGDDRCPLGREGGCSQGVKRSAHQTQQSRI